MAAIIQVTVRDAPGGNIIAPGTTEGISRDDLRRGFEVTVHSKDVAAASYAWSLAFTPDSTGGGVGDLDGTSSAAGLSSTILRTPTFVVDHDGAYLIRLVIDAGQPSEDTQFLRLRALTKFGNLKLIAAGERRDTGGVIPADADPEAWANDQNWNLQRLALLVRRASTSGRVLTVDCNRGRDGSNTINDPTNFIELPGPDASLKTVTGVKVAAEGFGDFSSINDAIAWAAAAVGRGEAVPSAIDPYFVKVRPGIYIETLALQPWVHVISEDFDSAHSNGGVALWGVRVTTADANPHEFSPGGVNPLLNQCVLQGLLLQGDTNGQPVLLHKGGVLALMGTTVHQLALAAAQPGAIQTMVDDPLHNSVLMLRGSVASTDAVADLISYALTFDSPGSLLVSARSTVQGRAGVAFNQSHYLTAVANVTESAFLATTGYAFRGYGLNVSFIRCRISTTDTAPAGGYQALKFDDFGSADNSFAANALLSVFACEVKGEVEFDPRPSNATTTVAVDAVRYLTADTLALAGAPGDLPTNVQTFTSGKSLAYDPAWVDPEDPPAGVVVHLLGRLGVSSIQQAIDKLAKLASPSAAHPGIRLDDAYDGLSAIAPWTVGPGGLGRTITADMGAVQIDGASNPMAMANARKDGGIQATGIVDIGGFVAANPTDTVAEVGGSDIHLNPNSYGAGPLIKLGRYSWPNGIPAASAHRAIPAAHIVAGHNSVGAPANNAPYNLRVRTKSNTASGTGSLGRLILEGGDVFTGEGAGANAPDAGSIFLQAGSVHDAANVKEAGAVWLIPGLHANGGQPEGRVRIVMPAALVGATLTAAIPPPADPIGVDGKIFFATADGPIAVSLLATDTIAGAIIKLNTAGLQATLPGSIQLAGYTKGLNSDIYYVGDDQGGALNAALGDFDITAGAPAVFGAGTQASYVELGCTVAGTLRVYGTIHADAYTGIAPSDYHNAGVGPYTVGASVLIVGCDTSGVGPATVPITLPATVAGRRVILKDEKNNAGGGVAPPGTTISVIHPLGGDIEFAAGPKVFSTDGVAITLYCDGTDWYVI